MSHTKPSLSSRCKDRSIDSRLPLTGEPSMNFLNTFKKAAGVGLNYQSIGSSGGIRQIRAKTVTFGATDAPLKGEELDKDGMVQFPMILGGVVPVINIDGFKPGELRVNGEVLADMFAGGISKWNDPKIAALNPGKSLPDQSIT
ncbi:MAG: hypothetical protein EBX72_05785, partial [Betaproteobacteria bacterium]|nr:hypothetical protein [Betaproteobacteria bacterium]